MNIKAQQLAAYIREHGVNAFVEDGKIRALDTSTNTYVDLPENYQAVRDWLGY